MGVIRCGDVGDDMSHIAALCVACNREQMRKEGQYSLSLSIGIYLK